MARTLIGLIAAMIFAVSAEAQVGTVQHSSGFARSGTSVAVPFKGNVTLGNVLFVAVSTYAKQTMSAPTDSEGNVYTLAATVTNPGNSVASIYTTTATSTGANTVTCHVGGSDNIHCHIYEVAGVTTTVDASGTRLLTGNALSVSTTAATTNASDYVLSYFAADNTQPTFTAGAGYADAETTNSPSNDTAFSEDSILSATGVPTATATASGSDAYAELVVAFKGAVPPGPMLILAPTSSSFAATAGTTPADNTFNISMSLGSSSFSAASDAVWLSVSPASGTAGLTTTTLTVSAAMEPTCPQYLIGHITVTAPGAINSPQTETVTYTANCIQHTVQMSWAASAMPPALDGYNAYRYAAGAGCLGSVTKLNSSLITTTTFADNTVVSGSTYCYYSTASSAGVESAPSNVFSLTVPTP
jgi:BACON domain-containing protein